MEKLGWTLIYCGSMALINAIRGELKSWACTTSATAAHLFFSQPLLLFNWKPIEICTYKPIWFLV